MKYLSFFFILIIFSCKTRDLTPQNHKGEMIIVGNGGGFTGMSTSFYLLPDGNIYRSGMNDTSFIKVGKLDGKLMDQQFVLYNQLGFGNVELDDPGNRYHFIIKKEDDNEHKIQWGRSKLNNPSIGIYHDNIMKIIKSLSDNN